MEGEGDASMEALYLWLEEMRAAEFDVIFFENSHRFSMSIFIDALQSKYHIVFVRFGSEDLGIPVRRPRTYAAAINKATYIWVGASSDLLAQQEFLTRFQAVVHLDGDVFAGLDSAANIVARRQGLARLRGFYGSVDDMPIEMLLPPHAKTVYKEMQARYAANKKVGVMGAMTADMSQSSSRPRFGPWLPSITTSSNNISMSKATSIQVDELSMGSDLVQSIFLVA
jgi:hypothetical protein